MRQRGGFTLMELIIVVIIVAILASVAFPQFLAQIERAREAEAFTTMQSIRDAEFAEFAATGSYAALPLSIDIDGDGIVDITMVVPQSTNFTFSAVGVGTPATAYIQAVRASDVGGRLSYGKCIQSGETAVCDAALCNPGC